MTEMIPKPLPEVLPGQLSIYDHDLRARTTDPWTSEKAGREVQKREGSTATVTAGSHKHRLLEQMAVDPRPRIDQELWEAAGLKWTNCPWHRISDLIHGGYVEVVDEEGWNPTTQKQVRRTMITGRGSEVLRRLAAGEKRVKL